MSLFTSLSPHRILNRFSRSKDPSASAVPETRGLELMDKTPFASFGLPGEKLLGSFSQPALHRNTVELATLDPTALDNELEHNGLDPTVLNRTMDPSVLDLNLSDLVCTAESVDLWSLHNDSHHNATNITTMHDNTSSDDFYYSPTVFLKTEPGSSLRSSPSFETPDQKSPTIILKTESEVNLSAHSAHEAIQTPSRKRRLSRDELSPSAVIAAKISQDTVPETPVNIKPLAVSKTWTPALDHAMLQCQERFKEYRRKHSSDGTAHKLSTQNKILSRLLFSTTGVNRTAKQISARLNRLSKANVSKAIVSPSYSAHSVAEDSHNLLLSPVSAASREFCDTEGSMLTMRDFSVAFNYKHLIQGSHFFTKLILSPKASQCVTIERARKAIDINNALFDQDFALMTDKLVAQNVPIFNVTATMDLRPAEQMTSTPTSPLTNPNLFTLDNGHFLTYMNVGVSGKKCKDLFISWKSAITIYKGTESRLLQSRESVNGYKNGDGNFTLEVPFLNNFWSGYLTFLSNGSNRFDELKSLYILQVIYDGEDQELTNIHGMFTYRFDIAPNSSGCASVTPLIVKGGDAASLDDNATILASSSPLNGSPNRFNFSIDTELANRSTSPGPMSVPTYNANLLYKLNPNYDLAPARPPLSRFNSVPHQIPIRLSFDPYIHMAQSYSSSDLLTIPSAGQKGMMSVPHPSPYNHQLQPGVPYSAGPVSSEGQYQEGAMHAQYLAPPAMAVVGPHGVGPTPIATSRWQAPLQGPMNVPVVTATSAPASQLRFFPNDAAPAAKEATRPTITFGPILEYDPSESHRSQPKRSKGNPSISTFRLSRQIMYKPKTED